MGKYPSLRRRGSAAGPLQVRLEPDDEKADQGEGTERGAGQERSRRACRIPSGAGHDAGDIEGDAGYEVEEAERGPA